MPIKDKLFSLFFCLYLFWYSIACIILGSNDASVDSSSMRIIMVSIFFLSLGFYFSYKRRNEIVVWGILTCFALLFYATQFFYPLKGFTYEGQFLRWGSECTAACLMGITLMKLKNYTVIHKILPLIIICATIFFVPETIKNASSESLMHLDSGMNYQTMAYTLAVLFAMSLYYVFINKEFSHAIIRLILILCMPIQAVTCCMAGGRGGVVLLVVYIFALSFVMLKLRLITKFRLFVLVCFGIVLFVVTSNYLNLWSSTGFARSSGLIHDDDRIELWQSIWIFVENNSYMGYGLGGDYYTFGFYTHNILLDFILELGIFGMFIMLFLFYKIYRVIFKNILTDSIFVLLLIVSLYGLVLNMFSGYWITTYSHWMALGVALTYPHSVKQKTRN